MRFLARLVVAIGLAFGFAAAANAQILEPGKDRAGGDYTNIPGTPNASQCSSLCDGQAQCAAWTWVAPGFQGPQAICYLKNTIPAQSADACCTSGVKLVGAIPPGAGLGKDRPGSDYNSVDLATPSPQTCAANCAGDAACKAWTYVNPGIQGAQARCYLKNAIPAQVSNSCCISAVKASPPLPPGAQVNKDRFGSDYNSFDLGSADPNLCYNSCQADGACAAWTYVNPGVMGPNAKCFLKNPVPAASNNPCCISGVKAVPALPPGAQAGKDRFGSDYNSFDLASANPNLCYNACQADGACAAWTYVNPGVMGPQAKCFLKNPAPAATNNPCCISGLKAGPPLPPGAQANKDRPGSDYSATILATPNPTLCYNACQADGSCAAWTYVKPGFQGPNAKCFLKSPAPAAVNNPCCISGAKAAPPLPPGAQSNKDRPGSDYTSMVLPSADPNLCYNACQSDGSCAAWSYVKPGFQGPNAKCFLKNPAPGAVVNNCCISGKKAVAPPPPPSGPFEVNVNRPGGDYIDFSSGGAHTALLCLAACATQPQCKAWTFVKPGIQGPQSHCWLKSSVPTPVIDSCCTSGVK